MNTTIKTLAASAAAALLAAGCGSSAHTTASRAASAAATTSTAAASPYGGGYGGGYGSTSSSSSSGSAPAALITTKHSKYGTVLAYGPKHLTVYVFSKDSGQGSSCTGQCAKFWPPVTGTPSAQGGASSADVATITRPGGGKQVTYKGHPLYLFTKDGDSGDAYGEGVTAFGGKWYAVKPSGAPDDLS